MLLAEIPASGSATVACACGQQVVVVDRYVTDFPPGPRGRNPESWVEFYRDHAGDPDDFLSGCPRCDEELELASVEVVR